MDVRMEEIYSQEMKGDTSFREKSTGLELFFGVNYKHKAELKKTREQGIKLGIEIGLRRASLEGQKVEMYQNVKDERQKEFLDKFYALCGEMGFGIQHHPQHGMIVVDSKNNF
jgi:hypothetical protein